ncbi:MAG: flagellar export chaperone FlgN [Mahellales bacterium]|jgi:hypothetical protein
MENTMKETVIPIIQCTREKRDRFIEILRITRKQTLALAGQSTEQLMKHIQHKQEHIDAIDRLDDRLNCLYAQVGHRLDTAGNNDKDGNLYPDNNCLMQLISETKELMKQIYDIEQRNKEIITARINRLKLKIQDLNLRKKSQGAYNQRVKTTGGVYIDSKS